MQFSKLNFAQKDTSTHTTINKHYHSRKRKTVGMWHESHTQKLLHMDTVWRLCSRITGN